LCVVCCVLCVGVCGCVWVCVGVCGCVYVFMCLCVYVFTGCKISNAPPLSDLFVFERS
jgi:hypothetical protein